MQNRVLSPDLLPDQPPHSEPLENCRWPPRIPRPPFPAAARQAIRRRASTGRAARSRADDRLGASSDHGAAEEGQALAAGRGWHAAARVAALFLGLLSLFGLLGLSNLQRGIYIAAFTLVTGALAVWLSITSIIRARRTGTMSPRGSVTATAIGAIGILLSGTLLIGLAAFGRQAAMYSQCLSGANTIAAQQACENQFMHAIRSRASGG